MYFFATSAELQLFCINLNASSPNFFLFTLYMNDAEFIAKLEERVVALVEREVAIDMQTRWVDFEEKRMNELVELTLERHHRDLLNLFENATARLHESLRALSRRVDGIEQGLVNRADNVAMRGSWGRWGLVNRLRRVERRCRRLEEYNGIGGD